MLAFDKATKILTEHFANLTPDEFEVNLREYCLELFSTTVDHLDREIDRDLEQIYQSNDSANSILST
jgi:hypothetical protein